MNGIHEDTVGSTEAVAGDSRGPAAPRRASGARVPDSRGRRAGLTPDRIAGALVRAGFEQPTVAAIARMLGVAPSALYNHVGGLDDVVLLAVDGLFGELPLRLDGEWRELLREEARLRYGLERRHHGLYAAWRATGRWSAVEIRRRDALVTRLHDDGWPMRQAIAAVQMTLNIAHDEAEQNTELGLWDGRAERSGALRDYVAAFSAPVRAGFDEVLDRPDAYFELRLDATLEGVAARVSPGSAA